MVGSLPKKIVHHPIFVLLIIIVAFALAFASLLPIKVQQMGSGEFFVEKIIPAPYWIGVSIIAGATFLMMRFLDDRRFRILFVFSSILLIISFRMVFPIIFTTVPAYEPDAASYMNIVGQWVSTGLNLGVPGNYQHDYPMSFLIAFVFVKFGVSVNTFYGIAPLFIYAIDMVILYALVAEIIPENKRIAFASIFLFSISSLGYWTAVHFCPDLVGSLFFFVSLYLVVRFVNRGELNAKALSPVLLSIFVMILSHHLTTLYFILTMFGIAFSAWFFKSSRLKSKSLWFLLLGVYTYTIWFAYGTLIYPDFFNVYSYFSGGYGSVTSLAQTAGPFNQVSFVVYPLFILILAALGFIEMLKLRSLKDLFRLRSRLREIRTGSISVAIPLLYAFGFIFVFVLFFVGFALTVSFPLRVLEVFFVGLYPVSSLTLAKVGSANFSKKKFALMLIIVILVTLVGIHRYYSQIQRRILTA